MSAAVDKGPYGLLAEFETGQAMVAAVVSLRKLGYTELDTHSPYPIEGAEEALDLPRSRVMLWALVAGLLGGGGAYYLEWWISAVSFPFNVGGRPLHSGPAFIPITFEMTVLFAAITSFLAVFIMSGLPRLWHPVFEVEGFERASIDRFFVSVEARDPHFELERTQAELTALSPLRVAVLAGER